MPCAANAARFAVDCGGGGAAGAGAANARGAAVADAGAWSAADSCAVTRLRALVPRLSVGLLASASTGNAEASAAGVGADTGAGGGGGGAGAYCTSFMGAAACVIGTAGSVAVITGGGAASRLAVSRAGCAGSAPAGARAESACAGTGRGAALSSTGALDASDAGLAWLVGAGVASICACREGVCLSCQARPTARHSDAANAKGTCQRRGRRTVAPTEIGARAAARMRASISAVGSLRPWLRGSSAASARSSASNGSCRS